MSANISALIPQHVLAGLHKTRLEGASLQNLRDQVATLSSETQRLRNENSVLAARFLLDEQYGKEISRRVGALEVTLPKLIEVLPDDAQIDRSNLTAAIGDSPVTFDTEGGSVKVRQIPMSGALPVSAQPLPAPIPETVPEAVAFGVAVGPSIPLDEAPATWEDLTVKLGPLLFGMAPLLADDSGSDAKRIIVGPIAMMSEATALCARLERVSVPCAPMPFTGTPLAY